MYMKPWDVSSVVDPRRRCPLHDQYGPLAATRRRACTRVTPAGRRPARLLLDGARLAIHRVSIYVGGGMKLQGPRDGEGGGDGVRRHTKELRLPRASLS